MALDEKERVIQTWPYPWPEVLAVWRRSRDDSLAAADGEAEKLRIHYRYGQQLDTLFALKPNRENFTSH